jgi:hypothetical protein
MLYVPDLPPMRYYDAETPPDLDRLADWSKSKPDTPVKRELQLSGADFDGRETILTVIPNLNEGSRHNSKRSISSGS